MMVVADVIVGKVRCNIFLFNVEHTDFLKKCARARTDMPAFPSAAAATLRLQNECFSLACLYTCLNVWLTDSLITVPFWRGVLCGGIGILHCYSEIPER